ncbi:MAG: ROK family protein [Actinomycetota bacterium]
MEDRSGLDGGTRTRTDLQWETIGQCGYPRDITEPLPPKLSNSLVIELGGTWTRLTLASSVSEVKEHDFRATRTTTPRETLGWVMEQIRDVDTDHLDGVAIAAFGPIDLQTGRISSRCPKRLWRGFELRHAFAEFLPGTPLSLMTDTQASALGEAFHGSGREMGVIAYVTVGTGVGLGLASRHHGILSTSGHPEFGHIRVIRRSSDRFEGVCESHADCLEGLVSGPALSARTGVHPSTNLLDSHPVWSDVCSELGNALATLSLTVAPDRIVLGGGISDRLFLLDGVRKSMDHQLDGYLDDAGHPQSDERLVRPSLGAKSALIGAFLSLEQ